MIIDGDEYRIHMNGRVYHCALDVTMEMVGGKWKTIVLWYLRKDKKRFSELRRQIPGITEKMLSLQLRQLEKDGFVSRTIYPEVPPRVEYALTPHGKTLLPLLEEIAKWGRMMGENYGSIEKMERPVKKKTTRKATSIGL
ncbi:MAG: helix-turn-helix transcriptional regulator [Flavobacteriales bacterium]|nr:helix-turn-helix transcriptional regulator [Flavobacteriales bacterium]MBK6755614.1 helix-turn-helix transcriptional regulator [Flavobacteriales bacterium]MBK7083839.1 helix-turn-helix transcriptional regulator [Flavobacteriales bacterium]MBK7271484.1 helix-turn-helix transcriptional regulator [Flavobacteriales bacterium]MBK7754565.1 helix-turn-helix transcriptional regulator [Flavobacteriales bacterium]